jgi:hypothetical protein
MLWLSSRRKSSRLPATRAVLRASRLGTAEHLAALLGADACRAPGVQTVVHLPSAGAESRQGLLWDLTGGSKDKAKGPYVLDEGASQGELYFRRNVVELGNGQSNMAFRIQPKVSTHTCEWHIVASYTDTTGSHEQRIPSGTGTFTTEAIPLRPVQYFEWAITEGGAASAT